MYQLKIKLDNSHLSHRIIDSFPRHKTIPGAMRSLPIKENFIGSVVIEILSFRQKNLTTLYNTSDYAPRSI